MPRFPVGLPDGCGCGCGGVIDGPTAGEVSVSEIADVGNGGGVVKMTETKVDCWLIGDENTGPTSSKAIELETAGDGKGTALVDAIGTKFDAEEQSPYLD
jgi:hypothetical protein